MTRLNSGQSQPARERPEPFLGLDVLAQDFLQAGPGAQLTALQRELFLDLAKDPDRLTWYARTGATNSELASIFALPATAIKVFEPVLAKVRALLNDRIRDAFLKAAEKGEPTALTYLAKKYLEKPHT